VSGPIFLRKGIIPVKKMRESKVHFGIGTDSLASNLSLDLFVEIQSLKDIQGGFSDKELLR
jgi:cytosine/adenosine deaminase-related metal-dependent hydrolase